VREMLRGDVREMLRACHQAADFSLVPELRPPKTKHSPNTPHLPTHSHGQKRNRHGNSCDGKSCDGNSCDGKSSECHPPGHSHACHQAHVSDRPLPAGQGDGTVTQATQCSRAMQQSTVTQATQCSRAHESDAAEHMKATGHPRLEDSKEVTPLLVRRQVTDGRMWRRPLIVPSLVSCILPIPCLRSILPILGRQPAILCHRAAGFLK